MPAGVKAQILATEHWSLLASRSMTWSEVMSRITIHLTIASASLVVLALFAQATGFGGAFRVMAIGLAAAVLAMGTLTQVRVINASIDDASAILGMNRLRAGYLDIDPSLAPYFVTSPHDDQQGLMDTYLMGWPRSTFSHVVASTSIFLTVVNAVVAGTLGALVTSAAGAAAAAVTVVGVAAGILYFGAQLVVGQRSFRTLRQTSRFPTPGTD
ncbi:MAG: hypothetical protein ABIO48_01890 [Pedococcus sp.]